MSFRRHLWIALILASIVSAAFAAGTKPVDEQFVHWQDNLLGRESGVYEKDGFLFVQVRLPVEPKNRMRMKGMALQESSAQLRRWALEQTRRDRGGEPSWPAAVSRMAAFNDKADPEWRFPPWRVTVAGRQFPSRETGGFFVQGQVYSKDALLKAIPESYRRHPTPDEVMAAFARNASAAIRKDKAAFTMWCGFFELPLLGSKDAAVFPDSGNRSFPKKLESFVLDARSADVDKARKEWKAVNKSLAAALRESSVCTSYIQGRAVTNEVVSEVTVTNPVVSVQTVTNQVVLVPVENAPSVPNVVVTTEAVTNYVAATMPVTNRTVTLVRDDSDRALLSAGLLRREPRPLVFVPSLPAADASVEELRTALRDAATDPRLWKALAARYKADGNSALSLACLLNALSLTPSDTDIVAEIALRYKDLKCPELAQGAALFAFAITNDEATREKVKPLLF